MRGAVVSNRALTLSAILVLVISVNLLALLAAAPAKAQDQYLDQYQTGTQYRTSDQYDMADLPAGSTLFFPVTLGNGASYSCTGGPPFVHDPASPSQNCPLQQVGPPPGYVCDIPTTITFIHDTNQYVADAWLCHSDTAAG